MEDATSSEQPEQSLRDNIVSRALEAFVHGGYSRTSTDAISRMLGISKKTLYKVFPSKEDILRSVVRMATRSIEERTAAIYNDHSKSVADRLCALVAQISPIYARIRSPQLLLDFQRAAPTVWDELRKWRIERYVTLKNLLEEGVSSGEIRNDIAVDDIISVYAVLVDKCMDYATLEESSVSSVQLYQGLMDVLLHGVVIPSHRTSVHAPTITALDRPPILAASLALFNKFGYTKTSADEIARSLGISKRTLYEQYMKKSHIATTLLIQTAREVDRLCEPLTFAHQDTYHQDLHALLTTYVGMLREITPTFTDDLAAALPRQQAAFMNWRRTSFEYHVSRAYAEGKRLETLRANTDTSTLIALLRLALENILLQPTTKRLAGSSTVADETVFTILYDGILQRRAQSLPQPTH